MGENTLNVSWEKSFYLNIYHVEIVQDYVDNVIKNLNLKIKTNLFCQSNFSDNKGIIESSTPFIHPVDSYIYILFLQHKHCEVIGIQINILNRF